MFKADTVDDQVGEEIYRTVMAIEHMCSSTYIVPSTVSKILAVTARIKDSLGPFRSVTEDIRIETRRYVNEIARIDQSGEMFRVVLNNSSATEVIKSITSSMTHQADNMRETSQNLAAAAEAAALEAQMLLNQAEQTRESARQIRGEISGLQRTLSEIRTTSTHHPMLW